MNIYCFSTLSFAKLQFKSVINKAFHKHGVASFTDAWIETNISAILCAMKKVASFTDAWIETRRNCRGKRCNKSHLLQMRGLKHHYRYCLDYRLLSHLLQMRGLKQYSILHFVFCNSRIFYRCVDWNRYAIGLKEEAEESHLLQMRGLKLFFL